MTQAQQNITFTPTTPQPEPSSFKLVFSLGLAGLLSGIILVGTFMYTNPMIKANREAAIQRAIFKVLPDCASYTTLKLKEEQLMIKTDDDSKEEPDKNELLVYAGYTDQKELIGFAIPGSEPGFQDVISGIMGYDGANKTIIGFEVLESKETPGLGDKIFKDVNFQTNFTSLVVDPEIIPVKNGQKQNLNEVEAITGATISSKAVVRLLNKSMDLWQNTIDAYIIENQMNVKKEND
jgi:electron transport complex protein RnfG